MLLAVSTIEATTWHTTSEDFFISQSDFVIRGIATNQETKRDEETRRMYTNTSFTVLEVVLGEVLQQEIIIRTRGGRSGNIIHYTIDAPWFDVGAEYFLFLKKGTESNYEVVGWTHGTFRVVNDRILKTKEIHGKDRNLSFQEFRDKVRASSRGEKVEWEAPFAAKVAKALNDKFNELAPEGRWYGGNPSAWDAITAKGGIDYYINPDGSGVSADDTRTAIKNAANTWNNVGDSYLNLTYAGDTTLTYANDSINTISWTDLGPAPAAYANPEVTYIGGYHILTEFDIEFNTNRTWKTDDHEDSDKDIQGTGTHEFGHAIGLWHTTSDDLNTMHGSTVPACEYICKRTLENGDAAGASWLYRVASGTLSSNSDLREFEWKSPNKFVQMTGDVTVPSGVTLTIDKGMTVEVSTTDSQSGGADASKCELIVNANGKLEVNGTSSSRVIFKAKNGGSASNKWYGIVFESNAGSSYVKFSDIQNAKYGVYVKSANPEIHDNKIFNCVQGIKAIGMGSTGKIHHNNLYSNVDGLNLVSSSVPNVYNNNSYSNNGKGIYMQYSSSPISFHHNKMYDNVDGVTLYDECSPRFGDNEIYDNSTYGIHLYDDSDPELEAAGDRNKITNNGSHEIYVVWNCDPALGNAMDWGNNDIHDNTGYAVYINTSFAYSTITAIGNYWGSSNPDSTLLFSPSDKVTFRPFDTSANFKLIASAYEVNPEYERLRQAAEAESNRQFDAAVATYDQLLSDTDESKIAERATNGLYRAALHRGTDLGYVIGRLEGLALDHPSEKVRRKASSLWRHALVADEQYDAAIAAYEQEIVTADDVADRLSAQTALGSVYMYFLKDATRARELLEPILRDYPNHPAAYAAWSALLDVEDLPPPAGGAASQPVASASTASGASSDIGLETSPNPFNPSTTVRFQLPETARVQLSIYNLLGQRVQELMPEELQPAGEYAVVWNGQDESGQPVGSGMYIVQLKINERTYTLETNERTYTRKVMLMR